LVPPRQLGVAVAGAVLVRGGQVRRGRVAGGHGGLAVAAGALAAPPVGEPPRRDGQQPAARILRDAARAPGALPRPVRGRPVSGSPVLGRPVPGGPVCGRPALARPVLARPVLTRSVPVSGGGSGPLDGRGEEGLLDGVLAGVEGPVPVPADERAEDLRREGAQQVLDVRRFRHGRRHISVPDRSMTALTSIRPPYRTSGQRDAISTARSTDSQSTAMYPAKCSLASTNGPSVTTGRPSFSRTVLAVDGSASASPPTSSPDSVSSFMIVSTSPKSSSRSRWDSSSTKPGRL